MERANITRSVRTFDARPIPRAPLEYRMRAAGTAPCGPTFNRGISSRSRTPIQTADPRPPAEAARHDRDVRL